MTLISILFCRLYKGVDISCSSLSIFLRSWSRPVDLTLSKLSAWKWPEVVNPLCWQQQQQQGLNCEHKSTISTAPLPACYAQQSCLSLSHLACTSSNSTERWRPTRQLQAMHYASSSWQQQPTQAWAPWPYCTAQQSCSAVSICPGSQVPTQHSTILLPPLLHPSTSQWQSPWEWSRVIAWLHISFVALYDWKVDLCSVQWDEVKVWGVDVCSVGRPRLGPSGQMMLWVAMCSWIMALLLLFPPLPVRV